MNRLALSFASPAIALALFLAAGCDKDSSTAQKNPAPAPQPASTNPAGTADGKAGGEHGHVHGKGDTHEGEKHALGKQEAGGYTVEATQVGELKPGGEAIFEVAVTGGAAKPTAVRAWVGPESAEGSTKAKGEATESDYDIHVELPATMSPDHKFWVELETSAGKQKVSFDLPEDGHEDHEAEADNATK